VFVPRSNCNRIERRGFVEIGAYAEVSEQVRQEKRGEVIAGADSPRDGETSRRDFLRKSGRRAMYVTPAVLSLSASLKAAALSGYDSTCGEAGSPCTADADCCDALTCMSLSCN